jgi:hypothetical protein
LHDFITYMQIALEVTQENIAVQEDTIGAMRTGDIELLLQAPLVRSQVLAEHPEFAGVDCIALSEYGPADLVRGAAYVVGGIATIGALALGNPELIPVVWTGIGAVLTGAGVVLTLTSAWHAIDAWRAYRQSRLMAMTGVDGPALVARETAQVHLHRFLVSFLGAAVGGAIVGPAVWRFYQFLPKTPEAAARLALLSREQLAELVRLHPAELRRFVAGDFEALGPEVSRLITVRQHEALLQWVRTRFSDAGAFPMPVAPGLGGFAEMKAAAEAAMMESHVGVLTPSSFGFLARWAQFRERDLVLRVVVARTPTTVEIRYLTDDFLETQSQAWGTDQLLLQSAGGQADLALGFGQMVVSREGVISRIVDQLRVVAGSAARQGMYPTGWRTYPTLYQIAEARGLRLGTGDFVWRQEHWRRIDGIPWSGQ